MGRGLGEIGGSWGMGLEWELGTSLCPLALPVLQGRTIQSKASLRANARPGGTSVPAYVQVCGQMDDAAASDLAWVWVITTGRSRLACAWATQQGGRAFHSDNQSSVKRSSDPRLPWFSGKRLGRGFWAAQLSRISWDTILASEKGTAREQSFNVRLGLYEHKTSQQLGRGLESAPCHHGNVRSQLQIKMETLWVLEFCSGVSPF